MGKEISKDVECDQADSTTNQECDTMMNDNVHEAETNENSSTVAEDREQMDIKLASYSKNEAGHYPCNICDKQYAQIQHLYRHIRSEHEGLKFPCSDCEHKATTRQSLITHIQSIHEGIKFPCNLCEYK